MTLPVVSSCKVPDEGSPGSCSTRRSRAGLSGDVIVRDMMNDAAKGCIYSSGSVARSDCDLQTGSAADVKRMGGNDLADSDALTSSLDPSRRGKRVQLEPIAAYRARVTASGGSTAERTVSDSDVGTLESTRKLIRVGVNGDIAADSPELDSADIADSQAPSHSTTVSGASSSRCACPDLDGLLDRDSESDRRQHWQRQARSSKVIPQDLGDPFKQGSDAEGSTLPSAKRRSSVASSSKTKLSTVVFHRAVEHDAKATEKSLVFLRRALHVVCLSAIAASIVILVIGDSELSGAEEEQKSLIDECNRGSLHTVRRVLLLVLVSLPAR